MDDAAHDSGPSEKDEAIWRAAQSSQPEVSLIVDGYAVLKVETVARHEMRIGEVAQLKLRRKRDREAISQLVANACDADWREGQHVPLDAVLAVLDAQ